MAAAIFWILKVFLLSVTCRGQVVEELKRLNIPPENLVGNEIYTDLTIDEILVQALGGLDVAAQKMIGPGGNILAELDMNMTEEQFQHFYPAPQYGSMDVMPYFEPKRKKRKAVRRIDLRWKNGTVPYYFARGHFSSKEEYMIKISMREWEKYTCIKFREKTNEDRNYIRFQNGQGCNSQLGMVGGEQILNLDANGCRWKGLYLHEIGHALGLVHEHQLPNRDQFIDIIFSNIAPSMRVWFQKYTTNEVNQFDVSYQLSSVMHYGMTAFSVDGRQQTIRPKNRTSKDVIGKVWRKELAFSDVKAVNRMYQCADSCSKSIRCGNGGFVDQNCKCICTDGTDDCQEILPGDEKKNQEDDGSCENIYNSWACNTWASQGECEINPKFMKVSCKKACGVCGKDSKKQKDNHVATWSWQWIGHFLNLFPKNWMIDDCKDEFKSIKCQDWAKNGDCVTNEDWMVKNCKKSCRKCKKQPTDANCRNAHTDDAECQKWARKGDCEINKDWMTRNCKKACKLCNAPTSDDPRDDQKDEPDSKDGNDRKPKNRDDSNTDDKGDCRDKHNTKQCKVWADKGECSRNPKWMIPNCRKSCSRCKDGTCKNLYDDRKCKIWARDRECLKNPVWMSENCAESCQTCEKKNRNDEDTDVGRREPEKDNDKDVKTTIKPKEPKDDPTTEDKTCQNDNNDHECNTWAKHGHCDINPAYMVPNCRKACKKCDGDSKGECFDTKVSCKAWAKDGFCSRYPANVVRQCRKSCGLCNSECFDRHTLCKVWAKANRCESDAGYMTIFCKKSCELC